MKWYVREAVSNGAKAADDCVSHVRCYGYFRHTTPHIDRFAQGGTLFERNYSAHIPTTSA